MIKDVSEFNDAACELFDSYLTDLREEGGNTRSFPEGEEVPDDFQFLWTDVAQNRIERYLSLLYRVGEKHFPEEVEYLDISNHQYQEL